MSTLYGKTYSNPKNINLKEGLLRFGKVQASNPFGSVSNGLYINASNQLVYVAQGVSTILGSGGGAGTTWEQLYQTDPIFNIASGTGFVINSAMGNSSDAVTITVDGASTGSALQFNNSGSGNDIDGSGNTWSISKAGVMTVTSEVIVSTANSVTTSTTNNTATTANVALITGSGVFTGSGANSFFNITQSGATTGTVATIIANGLTTGKALDITSTGTMTTTGYLLGLTANSATTAAGLLRIAANGLTSGIAQVISSSATAITGAGRLLRVDHTGATSTSGILSEFASAANDETVIVKITSSAALALGRALVVSVASMTTGNAVDVSDANALTTGIVMNIASSATAITTTGRLLYVNHSGASGTSAILSEFISAAADETVIVKITASAALALGTALAVSGASVTTGAGITANDFNALTTGIVLHIASSATAITTTGRLMYINHTGATGTSATLTEIASAANDETIIFQVTASAALAAGVAQKISAVALTTGTALQMSNLDALTSGIGIHIASSATAITGAGRMFYSNHTGATGTSATLNEFASAANDETIIMQVTASAALAAGVAQKISVASVTTGTALQINNANALTTGIAIHVASSATAITGAGRLLYVNHTGATGTSAILNEFASAANDETVVLKVTVSAALAAGVAFQVSGASVTTGTLLDIADANALTTGKIMNIVGNSADTGTRSLVYIKQDHASASGATALELVQDGALAALKITSAATSTNYFKIGNFNGVTFWMGNGTTANGNLSATAGDVLFNGGSNKPEYCTGTTTWVALV